MGCWAPQVGHIHCAPALQVDATFPKVSGRPEEKPWGSEGPVGTDELPPTPLPLEGTTCIGFCFRGGAHRNVWLGQDKSFREASWLTAETWWGEERTRARRGVDWVLNGRRSCARGLGALQGCASKAGGCLHLFWKVGPMSALLSLQLSTAREGERVQERRGAQDPRDFFAGPQPGRRCPRPPESPAPAPLLHTVWRRPRGRPATLDGMPAAMLPYACVLVLLGGRCHPPPTASLPEVRREGAAI